MDLTVRNHNVTYSIRRLYVGCPTAIVLYNNGLKGKLIHKNKKGYYICVDESKVYFDADMNEYLSSRGIVGVSEKVEKEILKL